jgi:hypothetical protein
MFKAQTGVSRLVLGIGIWIHWSLDLKIWNFRDVQASRMVEHFVGCWRRTAKGFTSERLPMPAIKL